MLDFLKIKSALADASAQAKELNGQIEAAKQLYEALQTLPLPRNEVAEQLCASIDRQAATYPERLARMLAGLANKPFVDLSEKNLAIISTNGATAIAGNIPVENLLYLFNTQIKQRITDAVNEMPYPDEVGPPMAERKAEMEQLEKEIATLEGKLDTLLANAREAGITINLD